MKEDEIGRISNIHVVIDKSVQNVGQKTPRENKPFGRSKCTCEDN
jgi:hypothetical protein